MNQSETDRYLLISCLKLVRILRLSKLIDYLNSSDDFKLTLKLVKMMFFLILYLHLSACLWIFVCKLNIDSMIGLTALDFESIVECKYKSKISGWWEPAQWDSYKSFM